ncbi:adenylate cyclase [Desulfocicer vacuolatum DSM 3385]|uniref:Adenylate cyclase n=1 Tax=Desulfocicer vacuolatum DSM 3385 TaxID=1121400 RepID=A0A1W2A378_9BACT|nr:CYTH domain-containing protein [Desulfocicer vacuolatum]SMC55147.1 adenylate cyclase [Desulfocicer vacuolatum DSM 3385]
MGIEIERKFLVKSISGLMPWQRSGLIPLTLRQGYLKNSKDVTVRIRTSDETGYITVKGPTKNASRKEFEYEIALAEAIEMLALCQDAIIEKKRYCMDYKGFRWEIDQFSGKNQGLVVAEIELSTPDEYFDKPPWLGREVTSDPRYCNACLATHPFQKW